MTINVISDLHLPLYFIYDIPFVEWDQFDPDKLSPADYLVIAGDISIGPYYKICLNELKQRTKNKFKKILYCKGNHDYWKDNSPKNHTFEIIDDNIAIIGTTMWSPISQTNSKYVSKQMNDFYYIKNFNVVKQNNLFYKEIDWLEKKVDIHKSNGRKVVVVTHHNPFKELIPNKFKSSYLNSAYACLTGECDNVCPDVCI